MERNRRYQGVLARPGPDSTTRASRCTCPRVCVPPRTVAASISPHTAASVERYLREAGPHAQRDAGHVGFAEVGRTKEMTRGWDSSFGRSVGEAAKMSCESPARRSEGDVPLLAAANLICTIFVRVVGFVLQIPISQLQWFAAPLYPPVPGGWVGGGGSGGVRGGLATKARWFCAIADAAYRLLPALHLPPALRRRLALKPMSVSTFPCP